MAMANHNAQSILHDNMKWLMKSYFQLRITFFFFLSYRFIIILSKPMEEVQKTDFQYFHVLSPFFVLRLHFTSISKRFFPIQTKNQRKTHKKKRTKGDMCSHKINLMSEKCVKASENLCVRVYADVDEYK